MQGSAQMNRSFKFQQGFFVMLKTIQSEGLFHTPQLHVTEQNREVVSLVLLFPSNFMPIIAVLLPLLYANLPFIMCSLCHLSPSAALILLTES